MTNSFIALANCLSALSPATIAVEDWIRLNRRCDHQAQALASAHYYRKPIVRAIRAAISAN